MGGKPAPQEKEQSKPKQKIANINKKQSSYYVYTLEDGSNLTWSVIKLAFYYVWTEVVWTSPRAIVFDILQ